MGNVCVLCLAIGVRVWVWVGLENSPQLPLSLSPRIIEPKTKYAKVTRKISQKNMVISQILFKNVGRIQSFKKTMIIFSVVMNIFANSNSKIQKY